MKKKKRSTRNTENMVVVLETRMTMLTSVDQVRGSTGVAPAPGLVSRSIAVERVAVARPSVTLVDTAKNNAMARSQDTVADSKIMAVKNHIGKNVQEVAVTAVIVAIVVLHTLLTHVVRADMAVKNSPVMAAKNSQAMVARKNRATVVKNRAMAVRSLLVTAMSLIPLADTAVLKALSMVVSALSGLMALLVFLVDLVEKRKSMVRGDRSMAQVDMVALAATATKVMGDDTKFEISLVGYFKLMCCVRSEHHAKFTVVPEWVPNANSRWTHW